MSVFQGTFSNRTTLWVTIGLLLASFLMSWLISQSGITPAIVILILIVIGVIVLTTFMNFRFGFMLLIVYSFILFELARILPGNLAMGVIIEIFLVLIFLRIAIGSSDSNMNIKKAFSSRLGVAILLYSSFVILELFNPNSTSISAKIVSLRELLSYLLAFYIAMHVFNSYKVTRLFTILWISLGVLVLIFAMKQEFLGFSDYEWAYLNSNPNAKRMMYIAGRWRKWSFLSDVSSFGLFSSVMGIVCLVLGLGPFKLLKRMGLIFLALLAFYVGSFSGTRTAWAIIPIGLFIYFFLNITDKKVLVTAALSVLVIIAIIFGPFYGGTISRVRTLLNKDDASLEVRDVKRLRLQPYVRSHPFGGGINTAGNVGLRYEPGHELAGQYDPDNGYLRIALERGWIGLALFIYLIFTVMQTGIKGYNAVKDRRIKIYYGAYLSAFFALTLANFTQDALDQKPLSLIVLSTFALMIRLKEFDNKPEST